MWRDFSSSYLRRNRSAGMAVAIATLVSALLLSLLLCLFYNAWKYEAERVRLEEGDWHSRILGTLDGDALASVESFARVRDVAVREAGGSGREASVDIRFDDVRDALSATPRIAELVGVPPERVEYNRELLALYMLRAPGDAAPRLVLPLFALISLAASLSLAVIIHSAFAVTMGARIHQLGILSSIGATPRQLRACLLQEAAALCAPPLALGSLLGVGACAALLSAADRLLGSDVPGRHAVAFGYHPLVLAATALLTIGTIGISAWLPARRLSRRTPLEAIRGAVEPQPRRGRSSPLLTLLFGVEGELAGGALRAQRRALRTASLSLALSLLAFTVMQCFFTLSAISTRETYFERYQGVWDVMVTLRDAGADAFSEAEAVRSCPGVRSAIVYRRAMAKRLVSEDEASAEMRSFGGFAAADGRYVSQEEQGRLVNAPIVVLDDASFLAYCEQVGAAPALDGAVIWNRIRDATNPDFRHPRFMPYLTGEGATSVLRRADDARVAAEIPVLAYADAVPALREEYAKLDYFELVHFLPASLWRKIEGQVGGAAEDSSICVLGREGATPRELDALQGEIDGLLAGRYRSESENRIRESEVNDREIRGMMALYGGFCALLAIIGIGGVFSNALGFVRQRRREFARYMSIGMTPGQLRRMFCVEALAIAGRPALIALPLAAVAVWAMLRASYMEPGAFLAEAPLLPVALFLLAIWGAVALAYALGWRNLRGIDLAEVLRDDAMS